MDGINKIRILTGQDLADIPSTVADIILLVDRDTPIANGTCPMPTVQHPNQWFILSTKIEITNLTMDSGGKTIHGNVTTLGAGTAVGWCFDEISDAWFPMFNTDRLAKNGDGSSLTGLTKTQVGLGSVDNTSDANKPISNAQQAALDAKLGVGTIANIVYSRVTGSNATTTGQVLTNVTGLSNALEANAVYEFEAHLGVQTSAVTTGTAYGMNYSAAGATIEASVTGSSNTTTSKTLRVNAFNAATVIYMAGNNQTGGIIIKGIVVTGANAGNLTVQHLKLTSGTSTVFINSYLKTIRIS